MTSRDIARQRTTSQLLVDSPCANPAEVVAAMGAIQAQDYLASLWAVGVRLADETQAGIEKAIADRKIVRTWPMRGTLHWIGPADVRSALEYLAPRVVAAAARRHRELELNAKIFSRSEKIFVRALEGGKTLMRTEMMALLERAGIATAGQRGYHILWRLALGGILCCGPRAGKQPTFVLLDEWLPKSRRRSRDEWLADFGFRYFVSHGPATLDDFAWWTGLKKSDAAAVLEAISPKLSSFTVNGSTYWLSSSAPAPRNRSGGLQLLPSFDEILIGYTNRNDAIAAQHMQIVMPGTNGMIAPIVVKEGRVIGIWKRTLTKRTVTLVTEEFTALNQSDRRARTIEAERYARFLGLNRSF